MYSKIRIIISSSFFGAGLRKKKKKNIRIFLNRNIAFGRIIYIYQSMTMSPMYNIFGFKTTAKYQSWMDWIFIVLTNYFKWNILVLWMTTGVDNPIHVQIEVIKLIVIRIGLACVYRDLYTIDFSGLKENQEFNFDITNSEIS